MPTELAPGRAIVPIVLSTPEMPITKLLGTGFFVGTDSVLHLITAKHVIEGNPLSGNEKYAIVFREEKQFKMVSILRVLASKDFDVAACEVSRDDFPEAVPLAIARRNPSLNEDVLSYEYSSTRIERSSTGHTHVAFEPYCHKGNIVRSFESTYEKIATASYLTSFPALQGASGAPILIAASAAVVGVTVANVERHLMPAQVVRIQHEGDAYDETRYFLPYGKAIARSVLIGCLEGMKIPFDYSGNA